MRVGIEAEGFSRSLQPSISPSPIGTTVFIGRRFNRTRLKRIHILNLPPDCGGSPYTFAQESYRYPCAIFPNLNLIAESC